MEYSYQLNQELLVNGVHVEPFNLEQGKIYYLTSNITGMEKWLLDKRLTNHTIRGKASLLPFFSLVRWFRGRSVHKMLSKRSGDKQIADFFFSFFKLPADVPLNELRGTLCIRMFNFEYTFHSYDLFFIDSAGLDFQSIDQLYVYLRERDTSTKCIVVLQAGISIYTVVESEGFRPLMEKYTDKDTVKHYRIAPLINGRPWVNPTYPTTYPGLQIDTIKAIGELLKFEGDRRLCALRVADHNILTAKVYGGRNNNYSLQVEALFIINQFFDERFINSCPLLIDRKDNTEATISGPIIDRAFKAYRKWYKLLKKEGIKTIKARKIMPLDGSGVRWW